MRKSALLIATVLVLALAAQHGSAGAISTNIVISTNIHAKGGGVLATQELVSLEAKQVVGGAMGRFEFSGKTGDRLFNVAGNIDALTDLSGGRFDFWGVGVVRAFDGNGDPAYMAEVTYWGRGRDADNGGTLGDALFVHIHNGTFDHMTGTPGDLVPLKHGNLLKQIFRRAL